MALVSLLFLLAQRSESPLTVERVVSARTVVEGQVLTSEGLPASGAVVVSDVGGRAITREDGSFRLEIELPAQRGELRITAALGSGPSGSMGLMSIPVAPSGGALPVGAVHLTRPGACQPEWRPTFGTAAGTSGNVNALAVLDDGSGPALYVGGDFERAGSVVANGIAKWDGARWAQLGEGFVGWDIHLPATVEALAVFDSGTGPELYAGGTLGGSQDDPFGVARWDGTAWQFLDLHGDVRAFAVFDDGSGPALYAGGRFFGTGFGDCLAKWDGTTWSGVGGGMDWSVEALAVFDDGSGPALYAGGSFDTAGGLPVNRIAKWDGTAWSALGSGTTLGSVSALAVFDDGSGPALYAGGSFRMAGGLTANRIAKWNGTAWSALGSGTSSSVNALTVFDDGGGPALLAAGDFTSAGGIPANRVARWDGSSWTAVGSGTDWSAYALAGFDDGSGARLYLGGGFELADGKEVSGLARWDGTGWAPIGGTPLGPEGPYQISDLVVFDDAGGSGPALHVAGFFTIPGSWGPDIARWDGSALQTLGSAADDSIHALAVFDGGGGPALFAGGAFTSIGGVPAQHVARWDGSSWAPLGSGVTGQVHAMLVFDDGGGDALYVGGSFTDAGGLPAPRIARWDGASWSALAGGTAFGVLDLAVYDDGGGAALYAAGTSLGGSAMSHIARWDGATWSALGTGIGVGNESYVLALEVFDDGSGPALYAGGHFSIAGGATVANVARWDGATWADVGGGVSGSAPLPYHETAVLDLRTFDDGGGPALCAGGNFTGAGGITTAFVARWDGTSWAPLGSGTTHPVHALELYTGTTGNLALCAAGRFWGAIDSGDSYLASWQGCLDVTAPAIVQPIDRIVRDDPGSPPGEVVTFTVTATDNKDSLIRVVCTPPSGSVFPPGVTLVSCQASDRAGNVASTSFRVIVKSKIR